ncbi:MAG: sigma-70 family RNA polymerase sigma factor [Candidatus Marinimicrobia bacterium]|nr:sigma-70 family RNA polymerase sigma factor [Candidatus Neomarinimicrobiota bacterium]MCH7955600.1 sigma-70 family RNA polymerase sigma factor [Candidatus Neomarinimicrobiota bacterium]
MNSEEKTDYELIDEAIDGNEASYGIIMERYKNSLHGIIYRMVRNQEETQDLVQEAFIKAYKALRTFNKQYSFSTWLFKIASNNCIDHLRKKRLSTISIDAPIETMDGSITQDIPDSTYNPEKDIIRNEVINTIHHTIDQLPKKYREVINLRHKQDKSYEEIAKELDLPIGTVKARIFRAREILKKSLRELNLR